MCKIQKIRKILGLLIYLELAMIPVMFLLKLARKIPMEIFIFLVAWIFANIGLIIFKLPY
jgi:hypothetical protein